MRGRRLGASSSSGRSVHQETSRKRAFKDQQTSDEAQDDGDDEDEFQKLLPTKRRKERDNQSQASGMSEEEEEEEEEEEMKLALQLSKQEAGLSALRLQQDEEEEEEALRRAIHQSMVGNPEACPNKPLPSLSAACFTRCSSRRACTAQSGTETRKCVKKRRRGESPIPESQQSSDSTHIEDSEVRMSPVFLLTGRRDEVHVDPQDQDPLQTCSPSDSALCSPDSWTSNQTSERPEQRAPNSPVFTREDAPSPDHRTKASPMCFLSSSPDSFTPSVASNSPVFPGSPSHPLNHHHHLPHDKSKQSDRHPIPNWKHKGSTLCKADVSNSTQSEEELRNESSDITLVMSDHDDITPVVSPSPVFPQEVDKATPKGAESLSRFRSSSDGGHASHGERVQTVRYLWGVPFCPRGEDPDAYTQVIIDQLDFYEKSLKQAQRFLMRKAEWSEPVLPCSENSSSPEQISQSPPHRRVCGRRRRRNRTQQEKEKDEEEVEKDEEGVEKQEEEVEKQEEEVEKQEEEVEKQEEEVEQNPDIDQIQTDECQVCPETPQSDAHQEEEEEVEEENTTHHDRRNTDLDPDQTPPVCPSVAEQNQQEVEEEEVMEEENVSEVRGHGHKDVRDEDKPCSSSPEPQDINTPITINPPTTFNTTSSSSVALVDCPLCQRSFSVHEVERHAADCDGQEDTPPNDTAAASPRRMKRKRTMVSAEGAHSSRKLERCYVCQQDVPLKDYHTHVERCIHRHDNNSRPTSERNLLSALEETEQTRDAAASGSNPAERDVINLLSDDDEDEDDDGVVIRTFTPISEAYDCLIDFKRHKASKMSRRRR